MKYNQFNEATSLVDDDVLLIQEASTLALKKVKLSTLKQYIGVATTTPAATNTIPIDYSLWLRADKNVSLNGDTVPIWEDQSSNKYNAIQPIKAYQPTLLPNAVNNLPALRFDGVDDFLFSDTGINIFDNRAIFLVVKVNQSLANKGIFSLRSNQSVDWNSADGIAIFQGNGNNQISVDAGNIYNSNPGSNPVAIRIVCQTNSWSTLSFKMNAGIATMIRNSSLTETDNYQINPITNTGGYAISARATDSNNANGRQFALYGANDIAEVICYNRVLSSSEEQAVNNYLNTKYKIY